MARQGRDLTGQRFGRLTVIDGVVIERRRRWRCRCDCGNETTIRVTSLLSESTRSCGCLEAEAHFKHGLIHTREYSAWAAAKARCYNSRNQQFPNYGGRGIVMCDEWRDDFRAFYRDMGVCSAGHTLDRRETDGPYSKANCRWATNMTQQGNRRNNRRVTFNGETLTVSDWARRLNIKVATLWARLYILKWDTKRALTRNHQIP